MGGNRVPGSHSTLGTQSCRDAHRAPGGPWWDAISNPWLSPTRSASRQAPACPPHGSTCSELADASLQLGVAAGRAPAPVHVHVGAAGDLLGLPVLPVGVEEALLRQPRVAPASLENHGEEEKLGGCRDPRGPPSWAPVPFPHLVVGQPDPERSPQAADGLGEERLAVGVGDGGQGGVEGLAEQQRLVPPEGFLQDAVSAVVVKEGAGGRGGVRRPRGAQGRVWGSKETQSESTEDTPASQGGHPLVHPPLPPSWGVAGSTVHGAWAPGDIPVQPGRAGRPCPQGGRAVTPWCHPHLGAVHQDARPYGTCQARLVWGWPMDHWDRGPPKVCVSRLPQCPELPPS